MPAPESDFGFPSAGLLSVYADGSSHGVAGRAGGWAYVIVEEERLLLEGSGGERVTTGNAMELQAVLAGLTAVRTLERRPGTLIEVVSDSRVALDVAQGLHVPAGLEPLAVAVREAFRELGHRTRWIRGHSGDRWNERVDALAHEAKQALVPLRIRKRQALRKR